MSLPDLAARMEERAAALAQPVRERHGGATTRVLVLSTGEQRVALRLEDVSTVVADVEVVKVPGVPRPWAGIHQMRGRLVALADVCVLLGSPPQPISHAVLLAGREDCALGVPAPPAAAEIDLDQLARPHRALGPIAVVVVGTTADGTTLLDGGRLLETLATASDPTASGTQQEGHHHG